MKIHAAVAAGGLAAAVALATPALAAEATAPSASHKAIDCGVELTFTNPTKWTFSFDHQVNDEAPSAPVEAELEGLKVKEGPWKDSDFLPRYQVTDVPTGGSKTVPVTFNEAGDHTVTYWLQRGPEQKMFLAKVTVPVDIPATCEPEPEPTETPTATPTATASATPTPRPSLSTPADPSPKPNVTPDCEAYVYTGTTRNLCGEFPNPDGPVDCADVKYRVTLVEAGVDPWGLDSDTQGQPGVGCEGNPLIPVASATPSTSPVADGGDLPVTGSPALAIFGLGALLVAAGGTGIVVSRRRKTEFQA